MSSNPADTEQSCEALLQGLNEDYQIIPMLKTVLQRGWTEPFKKSLKSYIDDHKQSLQDNCNKNYIQFCNNMDQILAMRHDVKKLRDNVTSFHDDISFKGTRVLRETERYMSYQNTLGHVGKASDDLVIFDSLLTMVERVNKLVDEKNYYLALKTLDTLKVSLKTVPECRLTRNLQAFIQPQTDKIISLCRSAFLKWCSEIRSVCRTIGEASMIRAFNRKHKDADAKLKKEGVEDILEKVDLSVVFEYQHVFEHASRLSEFKRLYIENRETQCDFDLLASRNLKALETSKFVSLLNGLLYASIGFFLVEDNLQRGSLLYNDSTHMQDLFNEQLKTLKEALLYHLRSISDVDTLLSIETSVWTYADVMSGQPLLFNVESIYEMRNSLVEQSVDIIKGSVMTDVGDAVENERFERYTIHSAEDFFGPISKYHLLDETPTSFPYVCEFTGTVPTVLQTISNAMSRFGRITTSLGVTDSYSPLHQLVTAILESLVAALQSEKESIEESEVHKLAILSLNFGAFAKSVEALQRILLANDDNHMGNAGLSLDKYRHDFIEQQSQIQDAMIEGIGNECTAILSELDDSEHLCPSNPAQQPHDCANRVMDYLKSVFERLSFMPRSLIEVCQFTSCRHIAQYMQSLLADGEGSINVLGVFNLNLDLLTLESRVEEFDTPDLGQCFNDIHQLFELLLSGHITDALDDEVRNEKYPMVAMPILMHVLERMKEVKKLPMLGRKVMIPMLKKRDVELVLNTLREQYEE